MSSTPRTDYLVTALKKKEGCNLNYRSEKQLVALCRELETQLSSVAEQLDRAKKSKRTQKQRFTKTLIQQHREAIQSGAS